MDRYNERLIDAKCGMGSILALSFSIALTVASLALVVLSPPLGVLLLAAGIALIFFTKDGLRIEYEFIITNGDIEIAKILSKKRRKAIGMIEASSINRMARADDERVANDISIGKYKVREFLGKKPGEYVAAIFTGEGDNQKIFLLDLDEKCVDHLNQVLKTKSEYKL
ncbi:MAG: hypothetical protein IJ749_03705 [Eubacterium sp.]|nr:hypothetical protein [Eubacterium sp.]